MFSKGAVARLRLRIRELEGEIKELRQQFKDLHKEQSRLAREKKAKENEIAASIAKCDDLQMLKFGQIIDLESLDRMAQSKTVDELRARIAAQEVKNDNEQGALRQQHLGQREGLLRAVQDNTRLLQEIAQLSSRQFRLEKELNSSTAGVHVADQGPSVKKEIQERNRLVQLVKLQAKEVDALKAEINMLRRKGGHVYTPAVPPPMMPQQSAGDMGGYGYEGMPPAPPM